MILLPARRKLWSQARAAFDPASFAPFDPLTLSLKSWHDFSDSTTLFQDAARTTPAASDSDSIGGVTDKSGTGNHGLQNTVGFKGIVKLGIQNGLSVIRFDGVDDFLQSPNLTETARTVFIVAKKNGAIGSTSQAVCATNISSQVYTDNGAPSTTGYNYYQSNGSEVAIGGTPGNWNILGLLYSSASDLKFFVNGGSLSAATNPNDAYSSDANCFAGNGGSGGNPGDYDVGERLICSRALTDEERLSMVTYLNSKWAIF